MQDERTPFLVAPLVSYLIRDKQSFQELTSQGKQMFSVMSKYVGLTEFNSHQKLMHYALNQIGLHGTQIYITDLLTVP